MERLTNYQEDVLADVLHFTHLRGSLYCQAKMVAPWGLRISSRENATFHIVTEGDCWLRIDDGEPVLLHNGDLVILPHGHNHSLFDHPQSHVTYLEDLTARYPPEKDGTFQTEGTGPLTTLICGGLEFEDRPTNPLFGLLPPVIHIPGDQHPVPWLQMTLELVKTEASLNQQGAETIITRLSEILFVQAVRIHLHSTGEAEPGWLGALRDPQIGLALALIHQHPDNPWTVVSLASRAGMSRSAFAAKFTALVGESVIHYITRWRLNKAAHYLRTGDRKLEEIALLVGYDSQVSLSKAFKRYMGASPGAYRRAAQASQQTGQNGENATEIAAAGGKAG